MAPRTDGARGRYNTWTVRILSLIGAGGMGEVYLARDTKLNRDVAIKVLATAVFGDPARLSTRGLS